MAENKFGLPESEPYEIPMAKNKFGLPEPEPYETPKRRRIYQNVAIPAMAIAEA